ncbi:MAG: hypothetical protein JST48_09750 [Bacteroidetes bacterium]|nr:hypothetical protein [Bacteroidota bacterium]
MAQSDCTLRKDQDSIKVYTCNTDTSKFKSIRTELTVHANLEQLENFILDIKNYIAWQYNTVESKILKKISKSEYLYYVKIEAPWPVADRDMVIRLRTIHLTDTQLYISANTESGIIPEKKGLVRVPTSRSQWTAIEQKKNRIAINYSIQIDPGGNVPSWLVNWVSANAPYRSFKKLKETLEKK